MSCRRPSLNSGIIKLQKLLTWWLLIYSLINCKFTQQWEESNAITNLNIMMTAFFFYFWLSLVSIVAMPCALFLYTFDVYLHSTVVGNKVHSILFLLILLLLLLFFWDAGTCCTLHSQVRRLLCAWRRDCWFLIEWLHWGLVELTMPPVKWAPAGINDENLHGSFCFSPRI